MLMADSKPQVECVVNPGLVQFELHLAENQRMVDKTLSALGARIKNRLEHLGRDQAWLAEKAEVSNNAVSKWMWVGQISRKNAQKVADILGISIDALLGGASAAPEMPEGAIPVTRTKIRKVWVVGIGEGGMPERVWTDGDYPVGASDRYGEVATDDGHAFIVQIRGDSMAPKYEPGGYALVLPSEPFEPEDDVLVRLKTGETMLKKFVSRRGGVRLASYNPAHPTIMLDERDVSWIYYVPHPMPARMINEWVGECTYDPPTFDERGGHRPAKDKRREGQS